MSSYIIYRLLQENNGIVNFVLLCIYHVMIWALTLFTAFCKNTTALLSLSHCVFIIFIDNDAPKKVRKMSYDMSS